MVDITFDLLKVPPLTTAAIIFRKQVYLRTISSAA